MLARELTHFRDATGDEILSIFIPGMVRIVLAQCAREEQLHADELQDVRGECASDVARAESRAAESAEDLLECERECEQFELRLAKANARADAYRDLVERNLLK
jgi:hypothetical protein